MYFNDERNSTNIDDEFDKKKKLEFNFFNKKYLIIILIVVILLIGIIGAIIILPKIFKTEYYLVLNGLDDMIVYQNSEYVDPGYQAYDNKDNDYTSEVIVTGEVDTSVAGEYKIIYSYNDLVKERIVTVVGDINHVTFLNLKGEKIVYLKVGETYNDPGYVVLDSVDANLEERVVVTGRVDTNTAGTYKLVYSLINVAGVTITAERTVIVMDSELGVSYSPEGYTNGDVTLRANVISNYFDYILLPDGSKSNDRNIEYKVSTNGEYGFTVYNKDGSTKSTSVKITNIDKSIPNISSCSADVDANGVSIKVSATDQESGIKEYKYFVNEQVVGQGQVSSYLHKGVSNKNQNVKVVVTDKVGNTNEKVCSVKIVDPTVGNENITFYTAFGQEYVIPKTIIDLSSFVKKLGKDKVSQFAYDECHDSCYNVAAYYAYMIHYGSLNKIKAQDACAGRNIGLRLTPIYYDVKEEVLYKVFEYINSGNSIVIQVNGGSGRHFVLAVGYRRSVKWKEEMTEADLLIIDAWDGGLKTMDKSINPSTRHLWKRSTEGWRVDVFK